MQKQQRGNTLPIGVKADTKGWMMELIEKGKQAIKYHLMDFKRVIWDNAIEHPRFLGYITGVVVWTVVFQATLSASEHGGLSFFVASFTGILTWYVSTCLIKVLQGIHQALIPTRTEQAPEPTPASTQDAVAQETNS